MQDTAGKRLCRARLARGLTVDEAAHETRMRPDKILALENDDFSRFGGNAYAKGFLLIYSRLLNVDVTEEARLLETPHDIRVRDYQYLNNAQQPAPPRFSRFTRQNKPSAVPLIVFLAILLASAFVFYLVKNFQRLDSGDQKLPLSQAPPGEVQITPEPAAPVAADSAPETAETVVPETLSLTPPVPGPELFAASVPEGEPANSAEAVTLQQPDNANIPLAVETPAEKEFTIGVKKKTKVTIRQDEPKASPKFSNFISPKDAPLKFHGTRLFIETKNPEFLEIRRNGEPVAYQAGNPIQ